jgi:hypothetical protein
MEGRHQFSIIPCFTGSFKIYLSIYLSICLSVCLSMALQPFVGPWPLFQFLNLFTQTIGLLGRRISPSQGRYLHTQQQTQKKRTQTSMPWVGFEPTIPVIERTKTFHALDRRPLWSAHSRSQKKNHQNSCFFWLFLLILLFIIKLNLNILQ